MKDLDFLGSAATYVQFASAFVDYDCVDIQKLLLRSAFDASSYFFVSQLSLLREAFLQTYVSSSSLRVVCDRVVETTFCYLVLGFNIVLVLVAFVLKIFCFVFITFQKVRFLKHKVGFKS
ncbi:hypothetical protein YC2023_044095 [Brassica napus]